MNKLNFFKEIYSKVKKTDIHADIEVFGNAARETAITWSEGKVEDFVTSDSKGLGLRIIKNGKVGFSYTNNFDAHNIDNLIISTEKNAEFLEADKYVLLASPSEVLPELDVIDNSYGLEPIGKKISLLKEMESLALLNKKIKSVVKSGYSESLDETIIINSNGLERYAKRTVFSYGISCLASDNNEIQVGGEGTVKKIFGEVDFRSTTQVAVENAVKLLGAKRIKTGNYPIVLNQNVGCDFLSLFDSSFSSFSVQKNVSLLKGKLNQKICSEILNIIDDGTMSNGIATSSFDDDGTPTQKTIIIENGILKNCLYDLYTANKDNVKSTGNASRGYSGLSVPAPSNIYIEKGEKSFDALLKEMNNGLYITEIMGMHNADSISGEFSVGVNGFLVENGEIKYPVHGITIAGNILEMFNNITSIGNDLKFYGSIGSPSILIGRLSVAGE